MLFARMGIPGLNEHGWLPVGIYDCSLEEAMNRFGSFQRTDRRPGLWAKFVDFIRELKAAGLGRAGLVDGSFVSAKPDPNDIDVVIVVPSAHDFSAELPPSH